MIFFVVVMIVISLLLQTLLHNVVLIVQAALRAATIHITHDDQQLHEPSVSFSFRCFNTLSSCKEKSTRLCKSTQISESAKWKLPLTVINR